MAREVYSFQVTIPAGTPVSTPYRANVTIPVRTVDTLQVRIPPGPSGLMGFAVTMGGINVIPIQPGTYVVANDQSITWPLTGYPDSGAWQISGYNTDVFDHTVYLTWLANLVTVVPPSSGVATATLAQLSS